MIDVKLAEREGLSFDLLFQQNDLVTEETLKTAVLISLFSDRRADAEELPPEESDRRGWWGDALNEDADEIGSKLWLLKRQKITPQVLESARQYCLEALQWLISDEIATGVEVEVERFGFSQISIGIELQRPQDTRSFRFGFVWGDV